MGRHGMMGFKPVKKIPDRIRKGASIYDPVIDAALEGKIMGLDTKDNKRSYALAGTIRKAVEKRDLQDEVEVIVRYSCVYVTKVDREEEVADD